MSKEFQFVWLDGWMTCDFTSFSTVFQSYQDDGRVIMKGLCNRTPFTVETFSASSGDRTRAARSVGQRLIYRATGLLSVCNVLTSFVLCSVLFNF